MSAGELIFGSSIVVLLLAVAVFTILGQIANLRALATSSEEDDTRHHLRARARRRIVCSILMVVLGAMMTGALVFLEAPANELEKQGVVAAGAEEHEGFRRLYVWFWFVFLLLLLALLGVVLVDILAIRRHARVEMRRIQDARRDYLARHAAEIRANRAGSNGESHP